MVQKACLVCGKDFDDAGQGFRTMCVECYRKQVDSKMLTARKARSEDICWSIAVKTAALLVSNRHAQQKLIVGDTALVTEIVSLATLLHTKAFTEA